MERAELALRLGTGAAADSGLQLIAESQPEKFMRTFAAAAAGGAEVFLCDPQWGVRERDQLDGLLNRPDLSQGTDPVGPDSGRTGWLMIPTGGSGGRLKFAAHDQQTLFAAVKGFTAFFELTRVNAVGVLPLHHVSGLMAWMRCTLTGGEYRHLDWKEIGQGRLPKLAAKPEGWVLSLVPTQLDRLLRQPSTVAWLRGFRCVFLGGGPAPLRLLDRAAVAGIPLSPGYGMTETAAMVTALRPEEFLAGCRSCGTALPHARVTLASDGSIVVGATSLFRGYYPDLHVRETFATKDMGRIDGQGHLHVTGRLDDIIISGGEKIIPAEVEAVLGREGGMAEVVVVGLPDPEWGQVVVAAYPAAHRVEPAEVRRRISTFLSPAMRPKYFIALTDWPVSSAGKLNRAEVERLAGLAQR